VTGGLAIALVAVVLVARRPPRPIQPVTPAAGEIVRDVAARLGCPPQNVIEAVTADPDGPAQLTVHAPAGFPVERFVLEVQAQAHNTGGRLDPGNITERGGYGLARLDGTLAGRPVRIVVIGDAPRTRAAPRRPSPGVTGELAIILDDAGYSLPAAAELAALPRAVAVAVLPNAPWAREVSRELHQQGREVLLHMPMEPLPGSEPGPGDGAITVGLAPREVADRLGRALEVVAGASGVNNHMGSRATADLPTMQAVMAGLRGRALYFVDSRTSPDSVAEAAARAAGIPTVRREVFLDIVDEPDAVRHALRSAVSRAAADGRALAIGHVHPVTIAVLTTELRVLSPGVRLVPPSRLTE